MSENKPIHTNYTTGGLLTQTSRIFPGYYEKSRFFTESKAFKERSQDVKELRVFQVAYKPWNSYDESYFSIFNSNVMYCKGPLSIWKWCYTNKVYSY